MKLVELSEVIDIDKSDRGMLEVRAGDTYDLAEHFIERESVAQAR